MLMHIRQGCRSTVAELACRHWSLFIKVDLKYILSVNIKMKCTLGRHAEAFPAVYSESPIWEDSKVYVFDFYVNKFWLKVCLRKFMIIYTLALSLVAVAVSLYFQRLKRQGF